MWWVAQRLRRVEAKHATVVLEVPSPKMASPTAVPGVSRSSPQSSPPRVDPQPRKDQPSFRLLRMTEAPVRDVVLFENGGDPLDPRMAEHPPIRDRISVGGGVYIDRLPADLNRKIKSASAFRGHHWNVNMNNLPTFYSFVRNVDNSDKQWDQSEALQLAVGLSRLCHPTSIGLEYAVRVYAPGIRHASDYVIEHSLIAGHGNQAFIPDGHGRNWLTPADVADLPALQAAFPQAPSRIKRAAWFFEYAARTEHVPIRLTLVAAGIEAVVHVERYRSTRQFVVGATGLARDCGLGYTEAQATDAYDQRSRHAHGASIRATAAPPVLIDLENVLRSALRRAILDASYGQIFNDDVAIRARFPL